MKLNLNQPLKNLDGRTIREAEIKNEKGEIVTPERNLTLGGAITPALLGQYDDERNLPGEKRLERWQLAQRLHGKAPAGNSGNTYFGGPGVSGNVTGSTNTNCGLQLSPGEWSPVLPAMNLNNFWYICEDTTTVLLYQVYQ